MLVMNPIDFSVSLFQVMPFFVTEGGKYVAHVLLKHKPKKAIVFVRTRGQSSVLSLVVIIVIIIMLLIILWFDFTFKSIEFNYLNAIIVAYPFILTVLAAELVRELEEYGLKCSSLEVIFFLLSSKYKVIQQSIYIVCLTLQYARGICFCLFVCLLTNS